MQRFSFCVHDILQPQWQQAIPNFNEFDLQVWLIDTNNTALYNPLVKLLNQDELERLSRFKQQDDKTRFVFGRGALRLLVGRYLNQKPETITFTESITKKPCIEICFGNLFFNLSHSGSKILIGFSSHHEIGVDIEQIRPAFKIDDFMERNYAANEISDIAKSAAPLSHFFKYWSRKEAWLKAVGIGVFGNLKAVDTTGLSPYIQTETFIAGAFADKFDFYTFSVDDYWASVVINNNHTMPHFYSINIADLFETTS
ncbi:MAG: 4'-phosphopantetheinyl transferase superfamily protein [Bacteroidia bacterium]|nr:4'-phosphopantetheinyl transferase superfamily protein [Bacteroidia bacterium]